MERLRWGLRLDALVRNRNYCRCLRCWCWRYLVSAVRRDGWRWISSLARRCICLIDCLKQYSHPDPLGEVFISSARVLDLF